MIRGKKNFLPPVQLVYGFGYLFKLDESSIGNHVSEKRKELTDGDDDDDIESNTDAANDDADLDGSGDKLQEIAAENSSEDLVQDEKNSPAESGKKKAITL